MTEEEKAELAALRERMEALEAEVEELKRTRLTKGGVDEILEKEFGGTRIQARSS